MGSRIAFGCKGDSATAAPVAGIADLGEFRCGFQLIGLQPNN
jgi:hypothetical protein